MARRFLIFAVVALLLSWGVTAGADDGRVVFTDGTSLPVTSVELKGTFVEVTLPNGAIQRYEAEFVDLAASGLKAPQEPSQGQPEAAPAKGRFSGAIAKGPGDGVKITDRDVGHVRPGAAGDEAEDEPEPGPGRASLMVSDMTREVANGVLTVNGKVTNTGTVPVTAITITAQATNAEGAPVGKATTSLSQTLEADGSATFTIAVVTSGTATNVRVSATAALSEFNFDEIAKPEESGEGSDEG